MVKKTKSKLFININLKKILYVPTSSQVCLEKIIPFECDSKKKKW